MTETKIRISQLPPWKIWWNSLKKCGALTVEKVGFVCVYLHLGLKVHSSASEALKIGQGFLYYLSRSNSQCSATHLTPTSGFTMAKLETVRWVYKENDYLIHENILNFIGDIWWHYDDVKGSKFNYIV